MRDPLEFRSIRGRLTFWFFLVALLPLLAFGIILVEQRSRFLKQEAFSKLAAIRDLKIRSIERWLEDSIGDMRILATGENAAMIDTAVEPNRNPEILNRLRDNLKSFMLHDGRYLEILVLHPVTGKVVTSTDIRREGEDYSSSPNYSEPLRRKDLFIYDIHMSTRDNRLSMCFAQPVFGTKPSGKEIVGIVVADVNTNDLNDLLQNRIGMGTTGETLIVNHDVLALNRLRWYENAPLKLKIEAEPAVRAAKGQRGVVETLDYRGEPVLAAHGYIPVTRWGFVAKQDQSEIYGPIYRLYLTAAMLLLCCLAGTYLLAYALARSLARPIVALKDTAGRIEQGDWQSRSSIIRKDEFGALANSINTLASRIESQLKVKEAEKEVSEAITSSTDLQSFGLNLLTTLMNVTGSYVGAMFVRSCEGKYILQEGIGLDPQVVSPFDPLTREGLLGQVLVTRKMAHIRTVPEDTVFTYRTVAGVAWPREMIVLPLVVREEVAAILVLATLHRVSPESLEVFHKISANLDIAFANLLANEETRRLARELRLQNQELEAQAVELVQQSAELNRQAEMLKNQNVELEHQSARLQEANRLKGEFLSNMSHELRTPLNSVLALSRVLIMDAATKLSPDEAGYLEIIERNGKHLLALINDILDLAKIEAGKTTLSMATFSLGATLDNILKSLEALAKEKGISLSLTLDGQLSEITSDEGRVHQILQNIIGNAIKFTHKGGVKVVGSRQDHRVVVEVIDTGIGIAEKDLPFIFDEFRQVDGSVSRAYGGTGLGLAIASKTARLLGGQITVESLLNQGSSFKLVLPVDLADMDRKKDDGPIDELEPWSARNLTIPAAWTTTGVQTGDKSIAGKRLLLVEDNQDAVIQIKIVLEQEGLQVDVVNGGEEALRYMQTTIPNGIILDLMMPGMDGFTVLEKLRGTSATAHLPVLILTAKDLSVEDLSKLSANNVQQLVQKGDVNKEGLVKRVKSLLGHDGNPPEDKLLMDDDLSPHEPEPGRQELPARPLERREIPNASRDAPAPDQRTWRISGDKARVLIIEDNPDNLATFRAILKHKFDLLEATDGQQGLSLTRACQPHLILLDMALPRMDGSALVAELKNDPATKHIPIVALTAQAMKGDREKILAAGCDDYVAKPVEVAPLIQTVEKWTGGGGHCP